ncbi:MAG TPA: BlaI/MecI/CopY family transcriptional regulator [Bacteroidales bacterium]|nr:BlaI/MecI/CopY family transcriptional regulator [Bacteroidales bacterium]
MMKKLTKAEEEIMLILWKIGEGTVRDVIAELENATAYTTVSTVIRVLEKKGFAGHKAVGTTHLYFPVVSKRDYLHGYLSGVVGKYFNGSFSSMASFFARENDLSMDDLNEILEEVKSDILKSTDHE